VPVLCVEDTYLDENPAQTISDGTLEGQLSVADARILWFSHRSGRWWVSVADYLLMGHTREQAYALFAMLCLKATSSAKGWGKVAKDGNRSILCYHLDDPEWSAIKTLILNSNHRNEV
jgi:hypothetical protein